MIKLHDTFQYPNKVNHIKMKQIKVKNIILRKIITDPSNCHHVYFDLIINNMR